MSEKKEPEVITVVPAKDVAKALAKIDVLQEEYDALKFILFMKYRRRNDEIMGEVTRQVEYNQELDKNIERGKVLQ